MNFGKYIQVSQVCLEGTTASKRRSLTGYEVPGISARRGGCLEGSTLLPDTMSLSELVPSRHA